MSIEKLAEHLPFMDGSGRRRFVAGGIILIGIAVQNSNTIKSLIDFQGFGLKEILGSPVLAGGVVLLIYAVGSLAEMLGELSLVRAASGIFNALKLPLRIATWDAVPARTWFYAFLIFIIRLSIFILIVPFVIIYNTLAGFIGVTTFSIDLKRSVSAKAAAVFESLPVAARQGLSEPVGNQADFAQKHIVDLLSTEQDRKWARRLLIRAKDVAATITALQVVVLYTLISYAITHGNDRGSNIPAIELAADQTAVIDAATDLGKEDIEIARLFRTARLIELAKARREISHSDMPERAIQSLRRREESRFARVRSYDRQIKELADDLTEFEKSLTNVGFQAPKLSDEQIKQRRESFKRRIQFATNRREVFKRPTASTNLLKKVDLKNQKAKIAQLTLTLRQYQHFFTKSERAKFLEGLFVGTAWLLFFPLYLGYFTTLRNAIISILEMAANQHNETATGTVQD